MPQLEDPSTLVDLYLRLSVAADGADSLERQETDGRAWATREGLTVRKVWRDEGKSGYRNVKREDFDAAVKALLAGEVASLWVWKLDRLSRKGAGQVGLLLDDLEKIGGRIVFYMDGLDSTKPGARLPIITISELARAESANTSLRVGARKATDRLKGKYLGGPAPYGYRVNADRLLEPEEPGYSAMREVVSRVLAGDSLMTICRDFNERGIPTRRGSAWRPGTLSTSLRAPGLVGLMSEKTTNADGSWKAGVKPWRHPETGETVSLMAPGASPIATVSEQARLLEVMDARLRQYGRGMMPVRQPESRLGGLVFCESCQGRVYTFGNSYRCRKWYANGSDCPAPLSVRVDVLEAAVCRAWAAKLASLHDDPTSPLLTAVADRWLRKFDPAPLAERAEVMAQIEETNARAEAADHDHYVRGTLDADRYAKVTDALRARLAALHARLATLPEPSADLGALLDPELSLPALAASTPFEARELLRLALVRVYVSPAPRRGARFIAGERLRFEWVGSDLPGVRETLSA